MKSKLTKAKPILKAFLLFFIFCSLSWRIQAQSLKEIEVTVIDGSINTALPSVSVNVKGSEKGGVTDANGKYSIQAKSTDVLVISSVGYEPQEVTVGNRTQALV